MPRKLPISRRLATAARWPVGVGLTSWRYMWRTTPMHRREEQGSLGEDSAPPLPGRIDRSDVQDIEDGAGPLFHRRYTARIREAGLPADALLAEIMSDPDRVSPSEFASFNKVRGADGRMQVGDEYVVRMPGPWDGPVRVVHVSATCFRLATLEGHLEAGQIEFRTSDEDLLVVSIESWARSGDRLSDLLYDRLRMAKEIQLHMWSSFLERSVKLSGGRLTGGIDIRTRRVDVAIADG